MKGFSPPSPARPGRVRLGPAARRARDIASGNRGLRNFECRASYNAFNLTFFQSYLFSRSDRQNRIHARSFFRFMHFVAERRADCLGASRTPAWAAPRGTPATKANCNSHTDILASPFARVGGATRSQASLNKGCSARRDSGWLRLGRA